MGIATLIVLVAAVALITWKIGSVVLRIVGVLCFIDGHVELVSVKEVLTETGQFPYPQSEVVWTRTPEENPNKTAAEKQADDKAGSKGANKEKDP